MNKQRYRIENKNDYTDFDVIIDWDHDNIEDKIKQMVEFWTGWQNRLSLNQGDYTLTFLQQLAQEVYPMLVMGKYETQIVKHFVNKEGWVPIDGTNGIELDNLFSAQIHPEDFEVREI